MQMGSLSADTHASAWDVGVKGEYRFETPNVDVIPYAGVHYTHLKTNGFDVTNAGQTVFNMESDTQNIWSFPLGVAFEKNLKSQNGWMVKPKASVGIIAAAGDLKARSVARIPGLDAASSLSTEVLSLIHICVITRYDLPARLIEVELLETIIHDNVTELISIIRQLRRIGLLILSLIHI